MVNVFYPIEFSADFVVSTLLGTNEGALAEALHFFIYDSIKIILLLFVMIFLISVFRTFIPKRKVKDWLGGRRFGLGNFLASLFGAVTPFCSCSSIPLFISFVQTRISLGIAFSFLITSPIINEYVAILMLGFFGWKITLLYIVSGLFIGTVAGIVLGKMNLEKYLNKEMLFQKKEITDKQYKKMSERVCFSLDQAKFITKKLFIWILLGVGIGAIIHGFVPEELIQQIITQTGFFAVPMAVLLGVPIYANCAAIVPVALVLFNKGVPLGTALAFMMATAALSLPEAVILKKVMKTKLLVIFFAIVALAIIITGYVFNLIVQLI